jgi:hypothetical protein
VLQITVSTAAVTVIAGTAPPTAASGSANGAGNAATLNAPQGIAIYAGKLYVCDTGNHLIRLITSPATTATVTTFAGQSGTAAWTDGTGAAAAFDSPAAIVVDTRQAAAPIYVTMRHCIRKVTNAEAGSGAAIVTTLVGTAASGDVVGGLWADVRFNLPYGIAPTIDGSLRLLVIDTVAQKLKVVGRATATETASASLLPPTPAPVLPPPFPTPAPPTPAPPTPRPTVRVVTRTSTASRTVARVAGTNASGSRSGAGSAAGGAASGSNVSAAQAGVGTADLSGLYGSASPQGALSVCVAALLVVASLLAAV